MNLFTRTDTRAEVLEGDCLDRLREMEDESVEAVVTDPPAGISFMNAEWDSNKGSRNQWIAWLTEVMEEVLRVTKPGGHALVWALPRTSHWTAMALEDAGWEVRDRISHVFGSGFPKSANISKQIDKIATPNPLHEFISEVRAAVKERGMTYRQLNDALDAQAVAEHVLKPSASNAAWPTKDTYEGLKRVLSLGGKWDWLYADVRGAERPVIGSGKSGIGTAFDHKNGTWNANGKSEAYDITAPATDAAKQWDGYGTALKPATEDFWHAVKPTNITWECAKIIQTIGELESGLCGQTAKNADGNSRLTPPPVSEGKGASALTNAPTNTGGCRKNETQTGAAGATNSAADTSASTSEAASIALNMLSSWKSMLEDLLNLTSRSTTETESGLITDLKTLNSLVSQITPESMLEAVSSPSGSPSPVPYAVAVLSGLEVKLSYIQTLSAPKPVSGHNNGNGQSASRPDASVANGAASSKPSTEDWWLCRKPLSESSIARNVLEHGCGGLNIDGARISHDEPEKTTSRTAGRHGSTTYARDAYTLEMSKGEGRASAAPSGRFPANLLLSHVPGPNGCQRVGEKRVKGNARIDKGNKKQGRKTQVPPAKPGTTWGDPDGKEAVANWSCAEGCPCKALDEMSGDRPSSARPNSKGKVYATDRVAYQNDKRAHNSTHTDSGGASRYFQQFHEPDTGAGFLYQSKASKKDRSSNGAVENTHPTCKPTPLLRYLIRLITPPGGTVLDCFLGSGSTGVAAVHEGFDFVGIEAEEEYAEIARRRIAHAIENPEV